MAYQKYVLAINKDEYDLANEVFTQFYERHDIDSITVEDHYFDGRWIVDVWVQCSTDDLMALKAELANRGISNF